GVPALLRVRQGDGQRRVPVLHAGLHIRDAPKRVSGEHTMGAGDRLLHRVLVARSEWLELRGKARGPYRAAVGELARVGGQKTRPVEAGNALTAAVEQMRGLKAAKVRDDEERPWEVFESKAAEAKARQQVIREERAGLDILLRERRQI